MIRTSASTILGMGLTLLATAANAGAQTDCARMAASHLCREVAERLPFAVPQSDWIVPDGCSADVAEADLGEGDWLFLRGARCGGASLALTIGVPDPTRGGLRPLTVGTNPVRLAEVIVAEPDPVAQILSLARHGVPRRTWAGCTITTPQVAGIPDGAWTFALKDASKTGADCGPFGAGASADGFWLQSGRYLFFFPPGNSLGPQPFDPATFNVVHLPDIAPEGSGAGNQGDVGASGG